MFDFREFFSFYYHISLSYSNLFLSTLCIFIRLLWYHLYWISFSLLFKKLILLHLKYMINYVRY